jgi:hypothetical protein
LSTETIRLEVLNITNKSSSTVIKGQDDSDNSKSISSFKMSFWVSPDSSAEVESYFYDVIVNYARCIHLI